MFENILKRFFDYDIIDAYYENIGGNHYRVKYIKKYRLRNKRKGGAKC